MYPHPVDDNDRDAEAFTCFSFCCTCDGCRAAYACCYYEYEYEYAGCIMPGDRDSMFFFGFVTACFIVIQSLNYTLVSTRQPPPPSTTSQPNNNMRQCIVAGTCHCHFL